MKSLHALPALLGLLLCSACSPPPETALGTLERDRITLPATVSERIAERRVREGEAVQAGQVLLVLEPERTAAALDAARAEVASRRAALEEAETGARAETVAEARARLAGARSTAENAARSLVRTRELFERQLLPRAELDRAVASDGAARAEVAAAQAALETLVHGTRPEQVAQARAALAAAEAAMRAREVDLARTEVRAPRDGWVDSLPYEVGDQVPVGTPLATMLVGALPYARVYVPQPIRASVAVGTRVTVHVAGDERGYAGTVRAIRREPGFTPYYALSGKDASRLSWLAEIALGEDAADLPAGLPVRADFTLPDAP